MTLYVANLAREVKDSHLSRIFSDYGPCEVDIKGTYGFIKYTHEYQAAEALKNTRGGFLRGQELIVKWSRKRAWSNGDHRSAPRARQTTPTYCADNSYQDQYRFQNNEPSCMRFNSSYDNQDNPASDHQQGWGKHVDVNRKVGCGEVRDIGSDGDKINDERIQKEASNADHNSGGHHKVTSESYLEEIERLSPGDVDHNHSIQPEPRSGIRLSNMVESGPDKSGILPPNSHNQVSDTDSKTLIVPNTATSDRGTVVQGNGDSHNARTRNLREISALEGSQSVEIENNLKSEEFEVNFQSTIDDQPRESVPSDDPSVSVPHRSQGIPISSAFYNLPSPQFPSSLHNLSNQLEGPEVMGNSTLLHADSNDSILPSPTTSLSSRNHEDNDSVLYERADRGAEDLEKILSTLDEEQRKAVEFDGKRPCIVLAGPGSGKTLVVVRHIAYRIIKLDLDPSSILALTFSNNAAAEMKERLVSLLGGAASDVSNKYTKDSVTNIKTIHGFCAQMLREHGQHINISKEFTICNAQDSTDTIRFLLDDEEKSKKINLQRTIDVISNIKTGRTQKPLSSYDGTMIDDYEEFQRSYDKYLHDMNVLDFDDLLLETRRLLKKMPEVTDCFHHIFVDEWQDTDSIQFDIIRMLSERHNQIYVVGDPDQSIYKFRGADVENIACFVEKNDNTEQLFLSKNYRSSGHIVNVAQSVINQNTDRLEKEMTANKDPGEKVRLVYASTPKQQAAFVANEIWKMKKSGKISSYSECAVLYRKNEESEALTEAISKKEIQYVLPKTNSFFGQEEIVDMLALLRVLVNPADDLSVLRVIDAVAGKFGESSIRKIRKTARKEHKTVLKTLEDLTSVPSKLPIKLGKGDLELLHRCFGIIRASRTFYEEMRSHSPDPLSVNVGSLLRQISNGTKYDEHVSNKNSGNQARSRQDKEKNIQKLIEEASSFVEISEFFDHSALEHTNIDQIRCKSNAVWLTTMHRSKGLEFKVVFIIGANERSWKNCDDNEERRLLYVAITRAKQSLTISWHADQGNPGGSSYLQRCRFLRNLPKESIKDFDLQEAS